MPGSNETLKPVAPEPQIEYFQDVVYESQDCTVYMNEMVRQGWTMVEYSVYTSRGGDLEPVYRDFVWIRPIPQSDDPAATGAMAMT